jgi:tryptophanyl-tRNA synthetase
MTKKRVLSGIRATGRLHLGNYLGAVKGMVVLQEDPEYETLYMIADLHTMTTPYDRKNLRKAAREVVVDYLACGLDPRKSVVFVQSDLADLHTQLTFYFSTVISVARMQHLPTFKDKVKQYPKDVTMALLNYPVLMAADILAYKAELVPVGIDQEPHLEVAREIARKINDEYGTDFPQPKRFATQGEYVPSLLGEGKMSKSVKRRKLAAVPTDPGKGYIKDLQGSKIYISKSAVPKGVGNVVFSGGVKTLMVLVELFQGKKRRDEYEKQYIGEGVRYKDLKDELAEAMYADLKPIREKRKELEGKPKYVDGVIKDGAEKARVMAKVTVNELRQAMGLS